MLRHAAVEEVPTTNATLAEVQEYAGNLARKRGLAVDLFLLAAAALPVTNVPRDLYASSLPAARKRNARRDPDDFELPALAIEMKLPVWSNDNDFRGTGVTWYTTASLLAALEAK